MAFPGRPPIVPAMVTQGYGFPGMRMVPMGMPVVQTGVPRGSANTIAPQRLVKSQDKKGDDKEKKPVTTVFIGNISDRAPDHMVKQMLQRCGNVLSWKRVQGASGKLQAFGFCEYDDPDSTCRCIRLLNEWLIAEKQLVAKVDAKTKALLDDYKRKKKARLKGQDGKGDESAEEGEDEEEEELDEETITQDQVVKASLESLMREYQHDLNKEPFSLDKEAAFKPRKKFVPKEMMIGDKDAGLDDMEIEDDKKDLINREIKFFRDSHKHKDEVEDNSSREKDFRDRERERRRREEREREYERERERREREREMREKERERERERKEREKERQQQQQARSRSRSRERSRERERREKEQEEEEELYE